MRHPSPTTEPGSQRAPRRRSQDRPRTEPSTRAAWPMYEFSPMTEWRTSARSAMRVLAPMVVYAPITASSSMVQFSPMNAGLPNWAEGSTDDPLPKKTPGCNSNPAMSTSTLPSRMSSWALR